MTVALSNSIIDPQKRIPVIKQDFQRAFPDAISLQCELDIIKEEFGLQEMDLLGSFDVINLGAFKQKARKLEQYIISKIENHSIVLNKYDTPEQFLAKNR